MYQYFRPPHLRVSALHIISTVYNIADDTSLLGSTSWLLQFALCYTQLMITVGLCLDGGRSLSNKFLTTRVMQVIRVVDCLWCLRQLTYFLLSSWGGYPCPSTSSTNRSSSTSPSACTGPSLVQYPHNLTEGKRTSNG